MRNLTGVGHGEHLEAFAKEEIEDFAGGLTLGVNGDEFGMMSFEFLKGAGHDVCVELWRFAISTLPGMPMELCVREFLGEVVDLPFTRGGIAIDDDVRDECHLSRLNLEVADRESIPGVCLEEGRL